MAVERPGLALLGDPPRPPLPFEKVCAVMPLAAIRGGRGRLTQLRFRPILRRRLSPYLPRPNMVRGKDRVSSIDIAGKTVDAGRVGIKRGGPAVGLVLGSAYSFLDLTALGRQEGWEEPKGRVATTRGGDPTFSS